MGSRRQAHTGTTAAPLVQRVTPRRDEDVEQQALHRAASDPALESATDTRQLRRIAATQPSRLGPAMRRIQRAYGNRRVVGLLQRAAVSEEENEKAIRRATVDEEQERESLRRSPVDEAESNDPVQRAPVGLAGGEVAPEVERAIEGARGGGQALDSGVRSQMEGALGADFGGVRVHTGGEADQLNRQISARAFTTGRDIFFRQGAYQPTSTSGRELLAHELTHVVQQAGGVRTKLTVGAAGDTYEQEADRVARAVVQREHEGVQRQAEEAKEEQREVAPRSHHLSPVSHIQSNETGQSQSNLARLHEMLDQFNIPEEHVILLLQRLTPDEKKTVISDGWYRTRMVSAFNFGEMVRAMANLDPELWVKLDWLDAVAVATRAIDYHEIKPFITSAPLRERQKLVGARWRGFFIDVCTNATIVEAVIDLALPLATQLEWYEAEVTSVQASISYADIRQLILNAPQSQRDALKTTRWRDFFVKVCDNRAIVFAVRDLNFDLLTRLEWILEEGNAGTVIGGGIDPALIPVALADTLSGEAMTLVELASLSNWQPEDQRRIRELMDRQRNDRPAFRDQLGEAAAAQDEPAWNLIKDHTRQVMSREGPRSRLETQALAQKLSGKLLSESALVRRVLDILTNGSLPHLVDRDDDVAVATLEAVKDDRLLRQVAQSETGRSLLLTMVKTLFKGINMADEERQQARVMQIISDVDAERRDIEGATTEIEVLTFLYGLRLGNYRGHTALVVGGLVYSFEAGWSCGHTKASYLAQQNNLERDGIGQVLRVSEEDARELQANLNQSCGTSVYAAPDICTGKAGKAIEQALKRGLYEVENPQIFVSYLEGTGLVVRRNFYPKRASKPPTAK